MLHRCCTQIDAGGFALSADTPEWNLSTEPGSTRPQELPTWATLLAEDNPTDAFMVEEAIRRYQLPLHLYVMKDGEEALAFLREAETNDAAPCPSLALLDLNLPKRTGIELLEVIRQSSRCNQIPVIIVTASDSPKDRMETAKRGATRYFRKPMGFEDFLQIGAVIREVLAETVR